MLTHAQFAEGRVSFGRLTRFLLLPDLKSHVIPTTAGVGPDNASTADGAGTAVVISPDAPADGVKTSSSEQDPQQQQVVAITAAPSAVVAGARNHWAVIVEGADFKWQPKAKLPFLKNISLRVSCVAP